MVWCDRAHRALVSAKKWEVEMLRSMKSSGPENDKSAAEISAVQPHDHALATKPGTASCIGSDMSIVGNIECKGPAQVFGRVEGELHASELLIGDGAQVEGSIIAQNVTVCGRVKGIIRAVRVKLQNGGAVEGDIFHRSLSIDENSLFEGSSRRVENPTEIPSEISIDAKAPQTKDVQSPRPTPDLQRLESTLSAWSESTVESRP
jgi:cytoskeletal protein CcmA (bactofilin family)